jgi:hypothetical protein
MQRFLTVCCVCVAVLFAAMIAGTPGEANEQTQQDNWEVSSPSDNPVAALRARVARLEQRVAAIEAGQPPAPEAKPVASSAAPAAAEPWQTPTVYQVTETPQAESIGQYERQITIEYSTETVCTGGVCRPQTTQSTGPLRRLFRR